MLKNLILLFLTLITNTKHKISPTHIARSLVLKLACLKVYLLKERKKMIGKK